ncbi:MAG: hypothetical protein HW382_888 [Deltaproteobacteria bacterium]|nr:hypothetical protein [Deltaproteobacteria bacterium]MBM2837813.1 hypothetical protein [Deltaproteobacteria bacterium]
MGYRITKSNKKQDCPCRSRKRQICRFLVRSAEAPLSSMEIIGNPYDQPPDDIRFTASILRQVMERGKER